MPSSWSVKIDHDGDGYFHQGVLTTDPLNLIQSPVLWTEFAMQSLQDATIITRQATPHGLKTLGANVIDDYYAFLIGYNEFNGGDPIVTVPGQTYRFALWARQVSGPANVSIRMRMASPVPDIIPGSTNLGPQSSTLVLSGSWQQLVCEFTETIYDTAGVTVDVVTHPSVGTPCLIEVTGFMLVEGTSMPTAFNAGDPTNAYDDIAPYITKSFTFRNGCRPFQVIADEAKLVLDLSNVTRMFSPEHETGPLYGYLKAFKTIVIDYGATRMWTGITRSWQPSVVRFSSEPICKLECTSLKSIYDSTFVPVELYRDHLIHLVVADLLFKGGFVYGQNMAILDSELWGLLDTATLGEFDSLASIHPSEVHVSYFGDTTAVNQEGIEKMSLYNALKKLCEAERGHGFWGRDGLFNFWPRGWLQNDTVVDATYDNNFEEFDYAVGTLVTNACEVTVYPRESLVQGTVAEFTGEIQVYAGIPVQFYISYKDGNRLYIGASTVSISGAETTWNGPAGVIGYAAFGTGILIEVSSSVDTILTGLTILGYPLVNPYPLRVVEDNEQAQIDDGLRNMLSLSLQALGDFKEARAVAAWEANRFDWIKGAAASVTFRHEDNGTDNAFMITRQLGDQIRLIEYMSSHDQCYHIVGEEHTIDIQTAQHAVRWYLEPSPGPDVWLIGDTGLRIGEDDLRIGHPAP